MDDERQAIASLDLNSNEFFAKAKIVIEEHGMPIQVPMRRFDEEMLMRDGTIVLNAYMERYLFVLMNTSSSQRIQCQACNRSHWFRQRSIDPSRPPDLHGLCEECGYWLVNMTALNVPVAEVHKWIASHGTVNPAELLRDRVETMIRNGEITMRQIPKEGQK